MAERTSSPIPYNYLIYVCFIFLLLSSPQISLKESIIYLFYQKIFNKLLACIARLKR